MELPQTQREILHFAEKCSIGRKAASLVNDFDVIAIDEGSTTMQMIPFLGDKKHLTVLTNSIPILIMLLDTVRKNKQFGKIILLGGEVEAEHQRVSGAMAQKMMQKYYVNKAFVSTEGITPDFGLTSFIVEKGTLTKTIIDQAKQTIVLADHSKYGIKKAYKICNLSEIHMIITGHPCPEEWVSIMQENGIEWIESEKD